MATRIAAALVLLVMLGIAGLKLYHDGYAAGAADVQAHWDRVALEASEAARAREHELNAANEKVRHELEQQKAANAAAARAHAQRLRQYQAALDRARQDSDATTGTDGALAAIASECGRALVALDGHARDLAARAGALQDYAAGVCVTVPDRALKGSR
jgi:hypothetical protein